MIDRKMDRWMDRWTEKPAYGRVRVRRKKWPTCRRAIGRKAVGGFEGGGGSRELSCRGLTIAFSRGRPAVGRPPRVHGSDPGPTRALPNECAADLRDGALLLHQDSH